MVKNTFTYAEFKRAFPDATSLKRKAEQYPFLTIYDATKTGKIIKHSFNPSYEYMMNGKWYSDWGEFKITNTDMITRYIPAAAGATSNIVIRFTKTHHN